MRLVTTIPMQDWRAVAPAAELAEAAGYDGIVTNELAWDPFLPLPIAALATERVELATGIVVAFPRSPMVVAYQSWWVHQQSGGRFQLGLGSQVKGHNERRFSTPWTPAAPRMAEYVQSLRAIWRAWEEGERLDFHGESYDFSLMTPEFTPGKLGFAPPPVLIAAVGPAMLRVAGRHCDGVRLHSFNTSKYTEEVILGHLGDGMAKSGRRREDFEIVGGGFIATGATPDQVQERVEWARYRIAFYGSTRTYHPVFAVHGEEELGEKLHHMSRAGEWDKMAAEVSDDVVALFTAIGRHDDIAGEIEKLFGGVCDTIRLDLPDGTDIGVHRELLQALRPIETPFKARAA